MKGKLEIIHFYYQYLRLLVDLQMIPGFIDKAR